MKNDIIQKHMTASPHTIGQDQTLDHAARVMREHAIRHLPVLDGGQIVGLLSNRDIFLVESLEDVDPAEVTVEEAMSAEPYSVPPDAKLLDVVREMAEHKYGAAVVMDGRKVVGIFTTVDALNVLASLLSR